jgi:hypothetical protein
VLLRLTKEEMVGDDSYAVKSQTSGQHACFVFSSHRFESRR